MFQRKWLAIAWIALGAAALSSCEDPVARLGGIRPERITDSAPFTFELPLVGDRILPRRNLISNGSFEHAGRPTLAGWRVNNQALTMVVAGTAPGGGGFALRLAADWAPTTGYVTTPIPSAGRGGVFRLSAYLRSVNLAGGGTIGLAVGKRYELATHLKTASTSAPDWTRLSLDDTVAVAVGDTLWVVLSSFHTEIAQREGLFDRVVLERMRPGGRRMRD